MAGDSLMDDPSSTQAFLDWAIGMTGGKQSTTSEWTADKDTQASTIDTSNDNATPNDVQRHKSPERKAVKPAQWEAPAQQSNTTAKVVDTTEPSSSNTTSHDQTSVPPPVVSIAHKASKLSSSLAPQTTSSNKLEQDLEAKTLHSQTCVTPSQRRIFENTNPDSSQKHQELLPNPFKKENVPETESQVGTYQSSTQGEPAAWERESETIPSQQNARPVEAEKGNTLMDSVHARSATGRLHFKAPYNPQSQQRLSTVPQSSSSVRMEDGEKHDPMEYFDNKRNEYYPPSSNKEPKAMLQSKDPNAPLRSPKKAVSRLNPQSKTYNAAVSEIKQEVEPVSMAAVTKNEITDGNAPLRENENNAAKADAGNAESQEEPTSVAGMRRDMEYVIKVLRARREKLAQTATTQDVDDEPATIKEEEESSVDTETESPPENVNVASRTLVMKNLPSDSDYTLVQSVIHGAGIVSMKLMQEENCAKVTLTDTDDCQKFVESCKNGVEVKHNGAKHMVFIEVLPEVNEVDSRLDAYLECGATRVIQADDVNLDLTMRSLHQLATGSTSSREVEGINDSFSGGTRKVTFRFTSIQDAVAFRKSLQHDKELKNKMEFVKDPCA